MTAPLPRRLLAEFLGSAFLAALVIGSGIAPASVPGFVIASSSAASWPSAWFGRSIPT